MAEFMKSPGSNYSRDRTGIVRVTQHYVSIGDATEADLDAFNPPDAPTGLEEVDRKGTLRDDGDWDLSISYAGGDESRFKEDVEIDWAGAEDPIETFPYFDQLAKKYRAIFDPQDPARFTGWNRTITDGGEKRKNPLYGFTHFLNDGAVLNVTYNAKNFSAAVLRNLCKIDKPKIKNPRLAAMAEAPDGKNWLKKSVKVSFHGSCFQYQLNYLLSGPGGWVPDVYAPKNNGAA